MNCVNHPDQDAPYQCSRCHAPICTDCETKVGGLSVCLSCVAAGRERLASRYRAETLNVNYGGGLLAGLLASLMVAFLWSQLAIAINSRSLGTGAAVLGGIVGYSVMAGAGGKRGRALQQMASALSLVGILAGHFLVWLRTQGEGMMAISGFGSTVRTAAYSFPAYLSSLSPVDAILLVVGIGLAYWVPHVRELWE